MDFQQHIENMIT